MSDIFMADAEADDLEWFAGYQRAAASAEAAADMLASCFATDVRDALPLVRAPTQVMHRRRDRAIPVQLGRELAARIPGAEMVLLDGRSHIPWVGDIDAVLDTALAFLDRHHPPVAAPDPLSPREREIAGLVALGMTNAEVAGRLSIALRTADAHLEHIRTKLHVRSRAEIAAWAVARQPGGIR
jgi:DNA-binding CsgD family transcriptional regulator